MKKKTFFSTYGKLLILLAAAVLILAYGLLKVKAEYAKPVFGGANDSFTEQLKPGDVYTATFRSERNAKLFEFQLSFVNYGVAGKGGQLLITVESDKTGQVVCETELPVSEIREWAWEPVKFLREYAYTAGETLTVSVCPEGFTEENALSLVLADGDRVALRVKWDQWEAFQKLYIGFAILLLALIVFVWFALFEKKWKTEYVWCVCMAVLLPVFMVLIPAYGGTNASMQLDPSYFSPVRIGFTAGLFFFMLYAIKRLPFGKEMYFVLTLLPVTLQAMTTVSIESIATVLAFLFLALVLRVLYGEKDRWRFIDYGLCVAAAGFLAVSRSIALFPVCLLLLPVFFTFRKSGDAEKKMVAWTALSMVPVCLILSIIAAPAGLGTLIKDPGEYIRIFADMIYEQGDDLLFSMGGVVLGEGNIVIPQYLILVMLILLLLTVFRVEGEVPALKVKERVAFGLIGAAGILCVFGVIIARGVASGEEWMIGTLGRGFLPYVPILMLTLRSNRILLARPGRFRNYVTMAAVFMEVICVTALYVRS